MFKPNRTHHLSAMKQLTIKALYLLVAISLAISGLTAPTVTVAANVPAKTNNPLMDANHMQYGSGWNNVQPDKPAQLLSEQLAALTPAAKEMPIKLDLDIEPAIYIPGTPLTLSWTIKNFNKLDLKTSTKLVIISQMGVTPQDASLAKQLDSNYTLTLPVTQSSGSMVWVVDSTAVMPINLSLQLLAGTQDITDNAVMVDAAQFDVTKGQTSKFSALSLTQQPAFAADKSPAGIKAPADATGEDLVFSMHTPSLHKLPYMSLSGTPLEILAVGKKTLKNVKKFNKPITIQVKYDPSAHPTWNEDDLQLFYYDDATYDWYPMATTVDKVNKTLTTQSDHLTVFDYKAASWQGYVPPTVDNFKVSDFTGAGTYDMSFWVPPAPGGLAPSLSLNYNSQIMDETPALGQSSWVGSGWNLDTGAILRNMHSTNSDITDDTYSISAGGITGSLLPVSTSGTVITYNTANQSYTKVTFDSSTNIWKAYDKGGTVYTFATTANLYKDGACGTPNLTWRWSLTNVTDINGKSLTYTYTTDKKTACAAGQQSDLAVYPATITYSNSQYRVNFVTEARTDYQTSWTTNTALDLYGVQRLQRIQVQMANGASWNNIRQYVFSYRTTVTNDINDPIYPRSAFSNGGLTLTLAGVQEIGNDGSATLPATSFYYTNKMHLGRVTNGQGGQVDLTYDRVTFFDDINKTQRSISGYYWAGGGPPQQGCDVSLWTSIQGTLRCDGTGMPQFGDTAATGKAERTLPEYMVKPGARYRLHINIRPINASVTTNMNYGLIDESNGATAYLSNGAVAKGTMALESSVEMASNYNATQTRLRLECITNGCFMREFALMEFLTYNRVLTRTVTDNVTGVTGTYSYHYDEEAPNTAAVSEAIAAGGTVYNTAESEFRGHSMSEVVDPQGLATVNFFYQNDTLKGRPYRSLLLKQTFYDDLNVTFPGTAWSTTGTMNLGGVDNISNYGLKIYSSTTTNSTALRTSTMSGNMAFAQFRINSTDTNTQGEVGLISTGGKFFGVVAKPVTGGTGVYVRTNTGGGLTDSSTALIPAGTFKLDKWYGVMLIMDNSNGFRVKAWQMGDLNNSVYESVVSGYTSDTWKLRAQANSGALWFDTPAEGTLYTESTTRYNVTTLVAHGSLATSTLQQYTDLNVNWAVPVESISRNYDGKSTWFGTRATTDYNTADQGGTQYGNATRSVASSWNGSAWVDDHASKTEFYPLDNGTKYLVGLPARSLSMSCSGSAADGSDCDFTGASGLLGETLNIYDANSAYSTAPTTGLLKITRARLDDSNGVKYGETGFSYDAWGNQTGVTSYSGYGTATSSPTIGARSVTRTYDTTYNTYVLSETNPLSQVTHTAYDYTLGLPNSVTDANNITTTAGYDAFGRMTSVVAPGDSSGSPTLSVAYTNYTSASAPFKVLLTQKLDASRTMQSVRSYNGLGKLIQSQTLAADVSGASKTIVQDSQYDILGRLTKQTKPYTYTGSYAFQTQTFGQPVVTTSYDILSRVTQVLDANGTHSDTSYSGLSTTQTDPKGNSTTSTSDVWGRVVSVAPATGPGLSYVYDKASHLTTVTKGTGGTATTTTLGYDRAGRKTSMSDPDMGSWSYTYDGLSALTGQTDARSCSTTIGYDLLGRPTGKTYAGAGACGTTPAVSYYYDGTGFTFLGAQIGAGSAMLGQRTGMTDGSGATVWSYDSRGRKTNESKQIFTDDAGTQAQTFSTGWSYNSADLPVTMTYPDSEVDAIGYNAQGALSSLKKSDNSFTYVRGLVYDEAGRTTNLNLGDTGSNAILSKVYSYFGWSTTDTGGQLNSMSVTNSASASLQSLVYNYDKNGNITSINNQKAGETSAFGYDSLNRLTGNTVTANVGGATVFQEAFAYDANTGSMSGKGPTLASLVSYTYDPNHKNAVSAFGTNGYGYDANGNQTSRSLTSGNYTLSYDAENHMVGVSAVLAPTATPTSTMTSSPTVTGTASPTASLTNTATVTQTASSTATQTATVPTATATATVPTATASNTALPSATATATLAPSATNTPLPSPTATNTLTGSETATSTINPTLPTATQTASLTATQVPPTNTPGNTNTPAATNTASVSPTASLTYTASVSPTVTNTVTATMTLTPSNTTTSSPTASPTGPTPTPTATTIPTEPTPEPLQSAKYVYDGDGNMVKAIVNSTLGNTTTTYYPGRHYNVEVKNGTQKVQKYYSAGSTIIAVRTVVNGTDTLQWMISDQIGSTSVTANADGSWNSEIRYTAFGEIRWKNGVTPTNYRYTGQLDLQASIGLQFYASRFYDSYLNHWIQPDNIIPDSKKVQSFDRYAYVNNSPIMFNDPTGHDVGCAGYDDSRCGGYNTPSQQTIIERQYEIPPVVSFIYGEIERNMHSEIVTQIRSYNNLSQLDYSHNYGSLGFKTNAYGIWANQVAQGHVWDHKGAIQQMETSAKRKPDYQQVGKKSYHFDTWSNIHYGFVGKAASFSDSELLDGSGLAQALVDISKRKMPTKNPKLDGFRAYDPPEDQVAIQIGIDLEKQYGEDLHPQDIIWAIEHTTGLDTK